MNTSPSAARVIETRYVWGPTLQSAMSRAQQMQERGWSIEGNPAPMIVNGQYGTGVAISRCNDE